MMMLAQLLFEAHLNECVPFRFLSKSNEIPLFTNQAAPSEKEATSFRTKQELPLRRLIAILMILITFVSIFA